jgi:transcriptional regulator with PAS, ATPase and Fis domain
MPSDTPSTVLITGETGTGKELVARAIHDSSPWAEEPFVPVNCTALPEGLLESELFGHVRGAFTGAVSDRRGRFDMAGRGTLFLDEIGDAPLTFQAKLLRVLEEGTYVPVGAERSEESDARVIAATHGSLDERVEAGDFRKDLYFRLRVVEIHLPPLRERPGDIPRLARHLIRRASRELERPVPRLAPATEDALLEYHWPGNVRELENCLIRTVALATGGVVRPADLTFTEGDRTATADLQSLEQKEREHVQRILRATGGNKTRAAEILGISRPRLYRLIEKHGLGTGSGPDVD